MLLGGPSCLPESGLVVSGTQDKYSRDADQVVARVGGDFITELRVDRGHALDQERFDARRVDRRPRVRSVRRPA
jgi:hypothetical protein